jgi:Fuc2NAc and GlcNAc transferase
MNVGWSVLFVFLISFFLTMLLRKYALSKSLMDIPNERSSHAIPTPRGGGLSIVIAFILSLFFMQWCQFISYETMLAGVIGGSIVSVIGFMDDHGHIAARWRLLAHAIASIWILFWVGGFPSITLGGVLFDFSWLGQILGVLYLIWMLNLYNFMDGIDGIAGVEAVSVCLSTCALYWIAGAENLIWGPLLLSAGVAGFLFWNFPPARIFMGDAGSGFLGLMLGLLSLQAARVAPDFFWAWLILLGVFIVDATVTLLRRLIRGEKVYEAHRSHAYQFASRKSGGHMPVTIGVGLINIFWLLPLALFVTCYGLDGSVGLLIAYAPLSVLAWRLNAGGTELKGDA